MSSQVTQSSTAMAGPYSPEEYMDRFWGGIASFVWTHDISVCHPDWEQRAKELAYQMSLKEFEQRQQAAVHGTNAGDHVLQELMERLNVQL